MTTSSEVSNTSPKLDGQRPITRVVPKAPFVAIIDGKYLGRPSERITEITAEIKKDGHAMALALVNGYKNGFENGRRGLALAHAQVNMRPWAFFVAFDIPAMETATAGEDIAVIPFYNPEIIAFDGRKRHKDELCLSFPFREKAHVERWEKVKGRWQDENMEWHEEWFEGKAAQVWQHEMEHLLGGTIYGAPMW